MSTHEIATTTAEQLLRLPDDGLRRELLDGRLRVMAPAGAEHGRVTSNAGRLLSVHVRAASLGVAFGAETGFVLSRDPDTVRAPDAAFVAADRASSVGRISTYWPGAPDLAIEVVSPGDSSQEVRSKARAWLRAGTGAVLVLDPAERSATVHVADGAVRAHTGSEEVDVGDVVPGWRVAAERFFD